MEKTFQIKGNIVDVIRRRIYPGIITVKGIHITGIEETKEKYTDFILPGFVDAHIHIESSMLIPSEFARLASVHGTVATVSDPHEIANVLGVKGVRYMIDNSNLVPFKFFFGASPCVPATPFETAGAELTPEDIRILFREDGLKYMSEMMNYPGVLFRDKAVMEKLMIAKDLGKPIDGHAPGLKGEDAKKYVLSGISTDHECYSLEEAIDKISFGMKVLIREGSAAKNFETLHPLIKSHNGMVMLCSDDKHPDDLAESHINQIVKRSLEKGYDLFDVLSAAIINPVKHYNLEVGLLQKGDYADFIVVDGIESMNVKQTYIDGILVAENGTTKIDSVKSNIINNFNILPKQISDFAIKAISGKIKVIEAIEGELITNELDVIPKIIDGYYESDTTNDILKISVINRYLNQKPSVAFIRGFGLKRGAIASSVAHDSHNIIAVGTTDEDICEAVNALINTKGGVVVNSGGKIEILPLPVAGIMSNEDGYSVAEKYSALNKIPSKLGCKLHAPFMTLSFMALLVIPALKLSDKGLFDGNKFQFTELTA
ncbi:MAG TPA: adenine deaminase [Ignavibacteria bacterium]